jgi:hypothetical protein
VAEVFGNGQYILARTDAVKLLQARTGADRVSCYRALNPNGRFGSQLHVDGSTLSWHPLATKIAP